MFRLLDTKRKIPLEWCFSSSFHICIFARNVMVKQSMTIMKPEDPGTPTVPLILTMFGWLRDDKNLASNEIIAWTKWGREIKIVKLVSRKVDMRRKP